MDEEPLDAPPPPPSIEITAGGVWLPDLNATQVAVWDDPTPYILTYGEKGCRTLDSMVYVEGGLKRLGRMRPDDAAVGFSDIEQKLWSSPTEISTATAYWVESSPEAIRVELAHGAEITGSPRHPIWTCWQAPSGEHGFGWKRFDEMQSLKAGGWRFWTPLFGIPAWDSNKPSEVKVLLRPKKCKLCGENAVARGLCASHYQNEVKYHGRSHEKLELGTQPVTAPLAYAIGALVGDGSTSGNISFTNADTECVQSVRAGLSGIADLTSTANPIQFGVSSTIKPLLTALSLRHDCYSKRIPDAIIEGPKKCAAEFLSGLFDTDGTVGKTGVVEFTTTSEALGRDVQDLLAAFGILAVRRAKKKSYTYKGMKLIGARCWTISIMGSHAWSFGQQIGFKISRKQARIKPRPKSGLRNPNGHNANRYGFPGPIRDVMRAVAIQSRTGVKKHHDDKVHRTRAWHDLHRKLHSFGSVPQMPKVEEFCRLYGCRQQLEPFLISENWAEIVSLENTRAELADLHVPGPNSFMAAGTLNHNSGKSIGGLHKLVRHCYDNDNALAVIVSPSIRTGNEGVLFDLTDLVLPAWKFGNRHALFFEDGTPNPQAGELMDGGLAGFDYTTAKLDPQTKDRHLWIRNMHNGWSKVIIISIPYEEAIEGRIKALSPSFVYVDELTQCNGSKYFTMIAAQLSRRRGIAGPQQWVASCNPEGPSHWVYQTFFVDCVKDGVRDPKYAVYHVPIKENLHRLPAEYRKNLESLFTDKVDRARLLDGEWRERPSGMSIFKDYYIPAIHLRGDRITGEGFLPVPGYPIIVGYDPGPMNFSVHFEQLLFKNNLQAWVVFDELNYVGRATPYFRVIEDICRQMDTWRKRMNHEFAFEHISDEAAFNQIRTDGSFDCREIERLSDEYRARNPGPAIRLKACPKGNDTVPARVRMVQSLLQMEQLFISAMCPKTDEMLTSLNSGKADPNKYDALVGFRPTRGPYIHVFDSMSYPMFYYSARNAGAMVGRTTEENRVYVCGEKALSRR